MQTAASTRRHRPRQRWASISRVAAPDLRARGKTETAPMTRISWDEVDVASAAIDLWALDLFSPWNDVEALGRPGQSDQRGRWVPAGLTCGPGRSGRAGRWGDAGSQVRDRCRVTAHAVLERSRERPGHTTPRSVAEPRVRLSRERHGAAGRPLCSDFVGPQPPRHYGPSCCAEGGDRRMARCHARRVRGGVLASRRAPRAHRSPGGTARGASGRPRTSLRPGV